MTIKELVEQEIAKGVSRRALAKAAGVSLGTVQNVLLGDTEIKNSTLKKFSRYFKQPVEAEIKNEGEGDSMEGWKRYALRLEKDLEKAEAELLLFRENKKSYNNENAG